MSPSDFIPPALTNMQGTRLLKSQQINNASRKVKTCFGFNRRTLFFFLEEEEEEEEKVEVFCLWFFCLLFCLMGVGLEEGREVEEEAEEEEEVDEEGVSTSPTTNS
jgi:hypothetical protein